MGSQFSKAPAHQDSLCDCGCPPPTLTLPCTPPLLPEGSTGQRRPQFLPSHHPQSSDHQGLGRWGGVAFSFPSGRPAGVSFSSFFSSFSLFDFLFCCIPLPVPPVLHTLGPPHSFVHTFVLGPEGRLLPGVPGLDFP